MENNTAMAAAAAMADFLWIIVLPVSVGGRGSTLRPVRAPIRP
jgi:hypothetical protein